MTVVRKGRTVVGVTPSSGQRAARPSAQGANRATGAASLGLAAVVVCLAAFSIFAAYTTRMHVDLAQRAESRVESYQDAVSIFRAEETVSLKYLLDPSVANTTALEAAGNAVAVAVEGIASQGEREDADVATDLLALHDRYLVTAERELGAMAAGDRDGALMIHENEARPVLQAMDALLTAAAAKRLVESKSAVAALREIAQWVLILAPIVFAIGFVLLLGFWRLLGRYQRATRDTYREIEQLGRLRGEFVSTVSHEFRTPLTGIQGFSELMRDEDLTPAETKEYAADINKDAVRLSRLINDMLDLDRLESGQMDPRLQPLDFNSLVAATTVTLHSSAGDRRIELDLAKDLPMVPGDPEQLTQVLTNLLGNAIKYSPGGSAIELHTSHEERGILLTVLDHGFGIPVGQLEKIFDRYSRTETAINSGIQGTGLGLAIVRQIVERHGGKVWATNGAEGGSVFHVRLPLASPVGVRSADTSPMPARP